VDTKTCSKCGVEVVVSEFPINGRRKDGTPIYKTYCKVCVKAYKQQWDGENAERTTEYNRQLWAMQKGELLPRQCKDEKCGAWFTPADRREKYCSDQCRRRKIQRDAWRRKAASKRVQKATAKTCKRCGQTKPKADFAVGVGLTCNDCLPAYRAEKHQRYKGYYKQKTRERKIRRKGAEGSHTDAEWEALKVKYAYTCLRCGQQEPAITLTRDHVKPLILGGTDYIENIQPLCHGCNSAKNDKEIDYR
jgi:hypothetical protein